MLHPCPRGRRSRSRRRRISRGESAWKASYPFPFFLEQRTGENLLRLRRLIFEFSRAGRKPARKLARPWDQPLEFLRTTTIKADLPLSVVLSNFLSFLRHLQEFHYTPTLFYPVLLRCRPSSSRNFPLLFSRILSIVNLSDLASLRPWYEEKYDLTIRRYFLFQRVFHVPEFSVCARVVDDRQWSREVSLLFLERVDCENRRKVSSNEEGCWCPRHEGWVFEIRSLFPYASPTTFS